MKSSITAILIVTIIFSPLLWLLIPESFIYCVQLVMTSSVSGILASAILKWLSERKDRK